MTAPPRFPPEYAAFRQQVRLATVRLRNAAGFVGAENPETVAKLADVVTDCRDTFALAAGVKNGERAELIKAWAAALERVA